MTDEAQVAPAPFRVTELVTPERAKELLLNNDVNRPIRDRVVGQYEAAMLRGEWMAEMGEPVYVTPDGRLINGQHRLLALLRTGTDVELPFVYDAPESAFQIADSGVKRTFADTLHVMGVPNARSVASIVTVLMLYEGSGRFRTTGGQLEKTNVERVDYYRSQDPEELQGAARMGKRVRKHAPPTPDSIAGGLWILMRRVDQESTEAFFEAVMSGAGLQAGDPVLALRKNLTGMLERRRYGSPVSPSLVAALWIKAFNSWRAGREVTTLSWKAGLEPLPVIEPPLEGAK